MTEEQWLRCTEPIPILECLRQSGAASERKLRLFAAACCRRIWHLLDADGRAAVETSERFADGSASEAELMAAVWANRGSRDIDARAAVDSAAVGAWRPAVALLASVGGRPPGFVSPPADSTALARERAAQERAQADLLRCVLGPRPFGHRAVEAAWRTPAVLAIAWHAYAERDFEDMHVLADALEEAGCADQVFLAHLRGGGPHCRGCFVLDGLLGKE